MLRPKGKLIAVGGAEDKGVESDEEFKNHLNTHFAELQILRRIKEEMRSDDPVIEVITTASMIPEEVGDNYINAFNKLNCSRVNLMHIRDRVDVKEQEYVDRIKKADGVMFSGGNQLRLSMVFGGSEILDVLEDRYMKEDFVIAGTRAGAMAMSNTMIYQGSSSEALLKGEVKLTTGLAFIKDVIIDSHFVKRGRFGRLAQSIATNPACVGVGLGEDTGLLIKNGDEFEAIGSGLVIIVDGHHIKHTNIVEAKDGSPISIENLKVHVMAKGNYYKLGERQFYSKIENGVEAKV
ncbi:MAG TPA: cyanophycinase [Bacteroidetes bacterium]|nr:cyanophycinase [Bacteroidota bacterium]